MGITIIGTTRIPPKPAKVYEHGKFVTIHGQAVLQIDVYKGWNIYKHWGGYIGKKLGEGDTVLIETNVYPFKVQVQKAINAFEDKYPGT